MSLRFFHSSRRAKRRLLLVSASALLPFVACTTEDPRPGIGSPGLGNSGGASWWNPGNGGTAVIGEGGLFGGGEGGARIGEGGASSGSASSSGGSESSGGSPSIDPACGDAPVSTQDFTKKRLLESAGACAQYHTCLFSGRAEELERQVIEYAAEPTEEQLFEARIAWVQAMDAWALSVPAGYGPVASVAADSYHGRGIGAFIHAWPSLNRCEVEKQVATRAYEEQGFQRILPGARGLSALEYLLFYDGIDTVCASNSSTSAAWAELSPDEIAEAKRDYAKAVAGDLVSKAAELVNVWANDGEDFGSALANAEGYGSQQEALNVVAYSLLYPYEVVRDLKVGPLAGIGTALFNPETPYALVDVQTIRANLAAFQALFQGCGPNGEGLGFDDWLSAVGAGDLSEDILSALQTVQAHAAALPPLHQASTEQMAAFYADLKVLSDLLKEELFGSGSVINLKLPAGAASDTD